MNCKGGVIETSQTTFLDILEYIKSFFFLKKDMKGNERQCFRNIAFFKKQKNRCVINSKNVIYFYDENNR